MEKKHREHLKSRKSSPFNLLSKYQEDTAQAASNMVWDIISKNYPKIHFNNFQSLGIKDLDANFALSYINRGAKLAGLPERKINELQSFDSASGIKPDGGIF